MADNPQTTLKCLDVVQMQDGKEVRFKLPDVLVFEEVGNECQHAFKGDALGLNVFCSKCGVRPNEI